MVLVSVVVPVYNVQDFLEKCVKSIKAQTYQELEIILVDDGSTDCSNEMCDKFAQEDSRIRVIHKKNGGLSDARNVGAGLAAGKYLFFLDSDDYVDSRLVEKAVGAAEKFDSDIVYFDYKRLEPNGDVEVCDCNLPEMCPISLKTNPELMLQTLSVCAKLFRRDFFTKTGLFFPVGYRYEDLGTIPKLVLTADCVVYLREPLYYYMIREGSITTGTEDEKNYTHRRKMVEGVLDYYRENGQFETFHRELEYLTFYNMYFIPAREMIYHDRKSPYVKKCRDLTAKLFPGFRKNPYIKNMGRKEKVQFWILEKRQFWMMNVLSWARKQSDKMRRR